MEDSSSFFHDRAGRIRLGFFVEYPGDNTATVHGISSNDSSRFSIKFAYITMHLTSHIFRYVTGRDGLIKYVQKPSKRRLPETLLIELIR